MDDVVRNLLPWDIDLVIDEPVDGLGPGRRVVVPWCPGTTVPTGFPSKGRKGEGVGVMKDQELNLESIEVSYTLGTVGDGGVQTPGEREVERVTCFLSNTQVKYSLSFGYYESRKRELQRRLVHKGRCDERLKAKVI